MILFRDTVGYFGGHFEFKIRVDTHACFILSVHKKSGTCFEEKVPFFVTTTNHAFLGSWEAAEGASSIWPQKLEGKFGCVAILSVIDDSFVPWQGDS